MQSTEECVNAPDMFNTVLNNRHSLRDRSKINKPSMLSYSESLEKTVISRVCLELSHVKYSITCVF